MNKNGVAEQKIRHLVDTSLALLAHANLPLRYWNYAFEMSCSSINNLPTPILNNSSPYFVLFHKHPDYSTQKPFGCTIFPLLRPYNNHKYMRRYFSFRVRYILLKNTHITYEKVLNTSILPH